MDLGPEADLTEAVDGGQLDLQRVVGGLEAEREAAVDLAVARQRDLRHQGADPARPRPPPCEDDVLHDGVQRHCAPGQHVLRHTELRQHDLLNLRGYPGRPGNAWEQNQSASFCIFFEFLAPSGAQGITMCVRSSVRS